MHAYDILMIVVLVGTTLFGFLKGMAWQIASLSSLILSYFVALQFSEPLMDALGWQSRWERFAAMLILYLGTSFLIWATFRMVSNMIDRVKLKEFDRQVGALFGAAKGILFCVVITFFVVTLSTNGRSAVLASNSGYYIAAFLDTAHGVMPEELHDVLHPYIHRLEDELQHAKKPEGAEDRTFEHDEFFPPAEPEYTPVDRLLERVFGSRSDG